MIATAETAAWTWDARPFPAFPARSDVWTDADNWRLGHWLNGRLGSVSLGSLVRELCRRAGLPDSQIDVSALADVVHGYLITALESPRASIAPLARHFGFDAVESEGVIRFQPRDRRPVATLALDDLVAGSDADAEVLELVRAQETELPQALKWQLVRADEEYDAMSVEARRATGAALRVTSETFAIATPAGDAERRCRRALLEEWVGRETASFRLPPSRLALDPGRRGAARPRRPARGAAADQRRRRRRAGDRGGAHRRQRLRPGAGLGPQPAGVAAGGLRAAGGRDPRPAAAPRGHRPRISRWRRCTPCPGRDASPPGPARARTASRWRRPSAGRRGWGGWSRRSTPGRPRGSTSATSRSSISPTARSPASPTSRSSPAPTRWRSRPRPASGRCCRPGVAELIAPGRYRLSRLLRGQRGTEGAIGSPAPAGARVVVLDEALAPLPIPEAALGLEANWRFGPASKPVADRSYRQLGFTPEGVGLRPFSVVHVRQPWRTAREPGDLVIAWTRRSRALAADSWTAAEAPLAEEREAYEVEILDGATVVRTLATTTTSVTYTAAQQLADFGALLGPGDTLAVRIFQLSALVGRGAPASVTLEF